MPNLRIIADENIPKAVEMFRPFGEVTTLQGREFSREVVRDADVLLVRSVTRVDERLIDGTSVRFVGSATIGTDHIETDFLHHRGIAFAHSPGSNAESVVEYVMAALLLLAVRRNEMLRDKTAAVIGCGNIGRRLADRLAALEMSVLTNDPPLEEEARRHGRPHEFRPLDEVLGAADVVSIHVPLVSEGAHATRHLINSERIEGMREGAWLVNTARGSVVDNAALLLHLQTGKNVPGAVVLDVWENEPHPLPDLVSRVDVATPHVAGYSYDGKVAGTLMLRRALALHLGVSEPEIPPGVLAPDPPPLLPPDPTLPKDDWLHGLVRRMYDIAADDERMRTALSGAVAERAAHFTALRRDYPVRRTFSAHSVRRAYVPAGFRHAVENGLYVNSPA